MKKVLLMALGVLFLASCGASKDVSSVTSNSADQFQYDIDYVKNAGDGMSIVKVWSYGKNAKTALAKCKASAVHGVIFKGFAGQGASQPALVRSANGYYDNQEFFDKFFKNGDYARFVSSVVDGSTETRKMKGQYKVSSTMTVNVKMLRKYLEEAGIIRGLATGF